MSLHPSVCVPVCPCPHALTWAAAHTEVAKNLDTLGIEPRASRMLSGCDTTTPRALVYMIARVDTREQNASGDTEDSATRRAEPN